MKLSILSTLLASAAAFQSASVPSTQTALRSEITPTSSSALTESESFKALVATAEASNPVVKYFDPMGLATFEGGFWGQSQEATIGFLRHSEIKHGRVAMFAFVGYLVHATGATWPFPMQMDGAAFPKLAEVGSVPALWDALPQVSKWQIILAVGALEFWSEYSPELFDETEKFKDKEPHYMRGGQAGKFPKSKGTIFPLDLYDPAQLSKNMSAEKKERRLVAEINNGRLAMIGIMGFLAEGAVPGSVPALKGIIPAYSGNVMIPFEGDFTGYWG
mmetsp:Transcript_21786/g.43509  ORF Transcript_21786/g.43509 Transcript_21786/m.43509 type:complete len:275 (-) Transcript_21786:67-891(-)